MSDIAEGLRPQVIVLSGEKRLTIEAEPEETLLQTLRRAGFYLPAICGGHGRCGKCEVKLEAGALTPSEDDRRCFGADGVQAGRRLACTAYPLEDMTISLPENGEEGFVAVNYFQSTGGPYWEPAPVAIADNAVPLARQIAGADSRALTLSALRQCAELADFETETAYVYGDRERVLYVSRAEMTVCGVAVDLGTTTVSIALVDLAKGGIVRDTTFVNKQRAYGADVISRITRANEGRLAEMGDVIRAQIGEGIAALCADAGVPPERVVTAAVAGNTTMIHLLLGLSCAGLGHAPFTPGALDLVSVPYRELFGGDIACSVDILPGLAAYVGSDITAGILYSGLHKARNSLLIDIGTNGEIALAAGGRLTFTSTAAGPAFEGGNILWGTGSIPGAISGASYEDGAFLVQTIGGGSPTGICGSGVIDITGEALRHGLLKANGKLDKERAADGLLIAKTDEGQDILLSKRDIREIQLAKSAIRSGLDALLHNAGLAYDDVEKLFVAGSFGYRINYESAVAIGLIPPELKPKVSLVGNSSLGGAVKYLLEAGSKAEMADILALASEYHLQKDSYFSDAFMNNIHFPK
ncbi:MAG: ASKHA domain-containing protein [Gracilibacteraceae bacterium]|nr:ASKHA domain-containing protein [Gracilibacteraceae bacterium]